MQIINVVTSCVTYGFVDRGVKVARKGGGGGVYDLFHLRAALVYYSLLGEK